MEPSKSISVKKEWLEKAKAQAIATRKRDYAVAISFGDPKEFYIIEDTLMEDLFKYRQAMFEIESYMATHGVDPNITEIIKEVFG